MQYKIGKIAKIMGVTPEAIRHYERLGLIVPFKDPETNYRYYTSEQIDQLLYIQRFSHMGISLSIYVKIFFAAMYRRIVKWYSRSAMIMCRRYSGCSRS